MLEFKFEETCPYCEHTCEYTIEDIDSRGFITCKECGCKHLACSICTHAVDGNGNCGGCSHDNPKWSLSIPDTEYVLEELINTVDRITRNRIVQAHRAEDSVKRSIESCMEQIEKYVHNYVRPYVSLLCMEQEHTTVVVITQSPMPNLYIYIHCSGSICIYSQNSHNCTYDLKETIVCNWKSVKESIHTGIQRDVKSRLNDLKEREDKAKDTQQVADAFEI